MKKYIKWSSLVLVCLLITGFLWVTYQEADRLSHHPKSERSSFKNVPTDFDLVVTEIVRNNGADQKLYAYYGSSSNGAYVMLQHGFKDDRSFMLKEAAILQRAGFGVLVTSVRAHDLNDGEEITFGVREMDDLDTWYQYLVSEHQVTPSQVGILGNSMGASMAIEYAALNPGIVAVVAVSPFSSLQDTIDVSVKYFTGLPPFPFAPMIAFWTEKILAIEIEQVNATQAATQLCHTPLFIMQGGADVVVSSESGQWLYDAACGEKELWFEADLGHTEFIQQRPQEYARRVVGFFRRYLLH